MEGLTVWDGLPVLAIKVALGIVSSNMIGAGDKKYKSLDVAFAGLQ